MLKELSEIHVMSRKRRSPLNFSASVGYWFDCSWNGTRYDAETCLLGSAYGFLQGAKTIPEAMKTKTIDPYKNCDPKQRTAPRCPGFIRSQTTPHQRDGDRKAKYKNQTTKRMQEAERSCGACRRCYRVGLEDAGPCTENASNGQQHKAKASESSCRVAVPR